MKRSHTQLKGLVPVASDAEIGRSYTNEEIAYPVERTPGPRSTRHSGRSYTNEEIAYPVESLAPVVQRIAFGGYTNEEIAYPVERPTPTRTRGPAPTRYSNEDIAYTVERARTGVSLIPLLSVTAMKISNTQLKQFAGEYPHVAHIVTAMKISHTQLERRQHLRGRAVAVLQP